MKINPVLELENIGFSYKKQNPVLKGISFSVEVGQVVCILGPSGCGKSTLLRIVAGLLKPTSGKVFINGKDQSNIPPNKRDIGFVFQNNALFPHLNVFENIMFPFTKGKRGDGENATKLVNNIIHSTGLAAQSQESVMTLSGGQQQRVALARSLVYHPSLLLLDEPLSSLDNELKEELSDLMLKLHDDYNISFVYVTHDEREAIKIGSHIAIIDNDHTLQQFDTVENVIKKPANEKVAKIIGGWNLLLLKRQTEGDNVFSINNEIDFSVNIDISLDSAKIGISTQLVNVVLNENEITNNDYVFSVKVKRKTFTHNGFLFEGYFNEQSDNWFKFYATSDDWFLSDKLVQVRVNKEDVYVFKND